MMTVLVFTSLLAPFSSNKVSSKRGVTSQSALNSLKMRRKWPILGRYIKLRADILKISCFRNSDRLEKNIRKLENEQDVKHKEVRVRTRVN